MISTLWCYYGLIVASALYFLRRKYAKVYYPLPPGPKPLPFIGNILDIPNNIENKQCLDWSHQYGSDVIHLKVLSEHMIIVNSMRAATALFEQKSAIYSDRPQLRMLSELVGFGQWAFAFMPYGEAWKVRRRLFHQQMNAEACKRFRSQEHVAAMELLRHLRSDPEQFVTYLEQFAGALIMSIAYGYEVKSNDDSFLEAAREVIQITIIAGRPGAFFVDALPFLKYLPEWFPGAGFQKTAKRWRETMYKVVEGPFHAVKQAMANGTARESVTASLLSSLDYTRDPQEQEKLIQHVTAIIYSAASDTTVSALVTFFLAMVLHPEVQVKAQEELDRVVGPNRLPDFSDEPSLPYIQAIIKEVLRWNPVTPWAVAHRLTEDDFYQRYYIPKGSIVIPNVWAMFRDEQIYPRPTEFIPDRFIKDGKLDPDATDPTFAFGFARRICPGRWMAMDSMWIVLAYVLHTFTILKVDGDVIEPLLDEPTGNVNRPRPFRCHIKPRSQQAEQLINVTQEWQF